jgi:Flp pilus assembly pilin Flp
MSNKINQFWNDEEGQDLIEYTLVLAFVALSSAALFTKAGSSVKTIWSATSSSLGNAALAATS